MKLLHPEVEIVPGKPGNRPAASPVPEKQPIPGSAVVRLTNTTSQENAYTVRLRCTEAFWQEAWYTVVALTPAGAAAAAGVKPDQRGPQDRWVKVYVPRGGTRDILIRFHVPQRPESRAGRYAYAVEVETQIIGAAENGARRSERVRVLPATATVRPYYKWGMDLTPEQKQVNPLRRRGEFDLVVTNEGNDWLYCDLQIPRPKDMSVDCYTLRLAVPPPEPGELLLTETGLEERPGTSRLVPLRAATKLKTVRGSLTSQALLVSAVRVDAPSVPPASPETGNTEGAVVAAPTTDAKPLPGTNALVYAPPIPAKVTDFFSHGASSLRTFVMSVIGLVLVAHMTVLLYQRYAFDAISVEPYSSNVDPGRTLLVRGKFLQGAQILMGTKADGFTAVASKPDLRHPNQVLITSVPAEFNHKAVQIKVQRLVRLLPLLTPLLPSATSKSSVQVGGIVVAADPQIAQIASGQFLAGKPFEVRLSGFDQPGTVLLNGGAVNAHWGTDKVTVTVPPGKPGQNFIVTIKPHDSDKALDAGSVSIPLPLIKVASSVGPKPGVPVVGPKPGGQGVVPLPGGSGIVPQPGGTGMGTLPKGHGAVPQQGHGAGPKPGVPGVGPKPKPVPVKPLTPGNLTAQAAGPGQIRVLWSGVPNAQAYVVYRGAAPGQHVKVSPPYKVVPVGQTQLLDTGLVPGAAYQYRIQAKTGKLYSLMSGLAFARTAAVRRIASGGGVVPRPPQPPVAPPPVAQPPITVTLAVSPNGHDLQATLNFMNASAKPVYLDKISSCLDGKIGDNVFYVTTDGQQVPFSGRKTPRPLHPGPRQFTVLSSGETKQAVVNLGRSYRLLPGTHTYTVTYSAAHTYPGQFQSLYLHSTPVPCALSR